MYTHSKNSQINLLITTLVSNRISKGNDLNNRTMLAVDCTRLYSNIHDMYVPHVTYTMYSRKYTIYVRVLMERYTAVVGRCHRSVTSTDGSHNTGIIRSLLTTLYCCYSNNTLSSPLCCFLLSATCSTLLFCSLESTGDAPAPTPGLGP